MSDRTRADEPYRQGSDDAHDGDRDDTDGSFFSGGQFYPGYTGGWLGGTGWVPFRSGAADGRDEETNAGEIARDDAYGERDAAYGETAPDATYADRDEATQEGNGWWDEGLITLLLVVGVVLFVFPEPATSTLGVVLIIAGLVALLIDWLG